MLKALAAHGVRADLVVGASVGAINGAQYAADPSAEGIAQLERIWCGLRAHDVFPRARLAALMALVRGRGPVLDPKSLASLFERNLSIQRLEDARIPLHVIATDALAGQEVCLSAGEAVPVLCATAAVPGLFPPVTINGRDLMDGAVANHTPISAAVSLGATRIIVLVTGHSCAVKEPPKSVVGMAMHALNLLALRQLVVDVERFSGVVELVVVPPLCPLDVNGYDFSHGAELIQRAYASTMSWLEAGGLSDHGLPGELLPHHHAED
ncbi:MAG: patatin-like phospholipase family protein [Gemmatimonadetes bacterium]|nr:patatin-like phospholipase family protein [Gemmatimonadota bacterium]